MKTLLTNIGLLASFGVMHAACNRNEDFPERIEKLRAIGVQVSPAMPTAGAKDEQAPKVTFFALSPSDDALTFRELPSDETAGPLAQYLPKFKIGSEGFTSEVLGTPGTPGALKLIKLSGSIDTPPVQAFRFLDKSILKLPFGAVIEQGEESEEVRADLFVAASASDVVDWGVPLSIKIVAPTADLVDASDSQTLEGTVEGGSSEPLRISWYVTSGAVENRRALSTRWKDISSGDQAVIATVRGIKSRRFAYDVVKFHRP